MEAKRRENVEEELSDAREQLEVKRDQVGSLVVRNESLERLVEDLEAKVVDLGANVSKLEGELQQKMASNEATKTELSAKTKIALNLQSELAGKEAEIAALKGENVGLREMSEHTTSRLNEVGRQLESAKSTLSSREKELRELTTSHRRISEDAKTAKKELFDLRKLKEESLVLKADLLRTAEENRSLQESKRERDQLVVSNGIQRAQIKELQDVKRDLEVALNNLKVQKTDRGTDCASVGNEDSVTDDLKSEVVRLGAEVARYKSEAAELKMNLEDEESLERGNSSHRDISSPADPGLITKNAKKHNTYVVCFPFLGKKRIA